MATDQPNMPLILVSPVAELRSCAVCIQVSPISSNTYAAPIEGSVICPPETRS